ncbi:hypothetical protein LSPH24S_04381 [Lysinibacillus sphaericus]
MIGILFGSIAGLYLAFYATGGFVSQLGFSLLAISGSLPAIKRLRTLKNIMFMNTKNG